MIVVEISNPEIWSWPVASCGLHLSEQDNLIRVYDAPNFTSGGFSQPRILSGHQRRAGVDGVLALVVVDGQLVSAGRDGRIIVWKDGVEAGENSDQMKEFCIVSDTFRLTMP